MFGLKWLDLLVIVGMIACFIGLKVCSKNQRTMKNAQLIAVLMLCGVFVCAGTLFWRQFLKDLLTDRTAEAHKRNCVQWRAQGYGLAKYINGELKNDSALTGEGVLVIFEDSDYNTDLVAAFKEGLTEGGIAQSTVEFKPIAVAGAGGATRSAGPGGVPGPGMMMMMTADDIQTAMRGGAQRVVISLVGVPPQTPVMRQYDRRIDFTNKGKRAFIVAGSVWQSKEQMEMVYYKQITAAVQQRADAPEFEDSYPEESNRAWDVFYKLATVKNAEAMYKEYESRTPSK